MDILLNDRQLLELHQRQYAESLGKIKDKVEISKITSRRGRLYIIFPAIV